MVKHPFEVGKRYTRADVCGILQVPEDKQKGAWYTGYTRYKGDIFIFCSVGIPGQDGSDYDNHFLENETSHLYWYGKNKSHLGQSVTQDLLNPLVDVYLFYRTVPRGAFTFAGLAHPESHEGEKPVRVIWSFSDPSSDIFHPDELTDPGSRGTYREGASKTVTVNAYERSPQARKECIAHYGCRCSVCDFDFEKVYGEIGSGFIHVHHLKQIADIKEEYELDPIEDLRPVCPNCHAMLHKRRPSYSIDEMKQLIKR